MESNKDLRLLVVLEADSIIVTMPGTSYSISYRKLHDTPWLVASCVCDDRDSPISKFTFRAQAWTAANENARELGWIVCRPLLMKELAETVRLRVDVEDDGIIVTLPGTTFRVIYHKTPDAPGLAVTAIQADKSAGIAEFDFLARAWRVANDKARELGWII